MEPTLSHITELLSAVRHPELKRDIVSLGMVSGLECEADRIAFTLRLLAGNDPFGQSLARASRRVLESQFPGVTLDIRVENPAQVEKPKAPTAGGVDRVRHIVAVASGKGGVGKSTVTVNLAVALARKGWHTAILDADVFGPSMPIMLGVTDEKPQATKEGEVDLIHPVEAYGVKMLSMGFFVNPSDALIWRGPMASNALKQLVTMGLWGPLDFLLIDMPPGTSDIHLTVTQDLKLDGAIIVTTPQRVALADAEKAISMFASPQLNIPVLGVVENMAWFEPAELPGHRYYIFGRDGAAQLAQEHQVPLLGQIPIVQSIREAGDFGCPVAADSSPVASAFDALADALVTQVDAYAPTSF